MQFAHTGLHLNICYTSLFSMNVMDQVHVNLRFRKRNPEIFYKIVEPN